MLKVGLLGAAGRMGSAICDQIKMMPSKYELTCAVVTDISNYNKNVLDCAQLVADDIKELKDIDVVIDFSNPQASKLLLMHCAERGIPLVIGTTGFSEDEINHIKAISEIIPIVFAPNMSLSVNVMYKVAEMVADKLKDYEVEIVEAHHRFKKDAPSGTALKIGEVIANAKGNTLAECAKYSRHGVLGERLRNDIGFSVIRGGDIVGMHEAMFIGDGEVFSLKSEITNRVSFANGALIAATFIVKKTFGLYTMSEVLDLT